MSEFERSVPNSTPRSPIRQGSVPNSAAPVPNSTAIGTYSRDRYLFRRSPIRILRYLFRAPVPGVCRHIHYKIVIHNLYISIRFINIILIFILKFHINKLKQLSLIIDELRYIKLHRWHPCRIFIFMLSMIAHARKQVEMVVD